MSKMSKILAIAGSVLCFVGLYVTLITTSINEEEASIQTCYKNNMVRVQTPAGPRCAKIENLVEIK